MNLVSLGIKNFKSLKDIYILIDDLTVIIGPNASGKSNLADAVRFLTLVYEHGLETAISDLGGFSNLVFSSSKKKASLTVEFNVELLISKEEIHDDEYLAHALKAYQEENLENEKEAYLLRHTFSFKSNSNNLRSYYNIIKEEFAIMDLEVQEYVKSKDEKNFLRLAIFERKSKGQARSINVLSLKGINDPLVLLFNSFIKSELDKSEIPVSDQVLLIENKYHPVFRLFSQFISDWAVFRLSPYDTRKPSAVTPNPKISITGENLPALVDWIIRNMPETWQGIIETMQSILPNLKSISTQFLHNKRLGIFFQEENISRIWTSDEVSDGTIQTLAILCTLEDPRSGLLFIEEPENSLHPWILRLLVEQFKKTSRRKEIIITTHSPTLIDMFEPKNIWCISRENGISSLRELIELAPDIQKAWEEGEYNISDYLDAGLLPQVVPGGSV